MSFFPYFHFFTTIVYFYLGVYIFTKNRKAVVNRICAAFILCLGLWNFSLVFCHNPYSSPKIARLVSDFTAFGWVSFNSFFLWFILAFSGKKILKKKWFYLLLFGIPLVFIYKQWTGYLYTDFIEVYYGWAPLIDLSTWFSLFYLYSLSFMGTALYINIDFMRKTRNPVLKKQAKIIFVTMMITVVSGTVSDILLPLLKIHVIPNMAGSLTLTWVVGVVYAMVKYKFLTITPAAAAGNIISTMFDCLILLNLDGHIVTANKAVSNLLGYEEHELKGKPVGMLFTGKESESGPAKRILAEGDLKNMDIAFKTKKGKEIPVLFSSSVLRDEAGTAGGIVWVAKDISSRKKLEQEIFKSKKLESIGILAGGIAHDFNNILSVIMGNITLIQDEIPREGKAHEYLVILEEFTLKAAELTQKFISFSPGGWMEREKVTVRGILKNVTGPGPAVPNISYEIDIPGDLVPILGDDAQLSQAVRNLFSNAEEAMPGGGKISVRAENVAIGNKSKLPIEKGKYVKILIEDNGGGIPSGNIEKVFDPYFSTKGKGIQKGLGLGLTLCYSIIKKHGGHIAIESEEGKGTTVIMYLPTFVTSSFANPGGLP